MRTFLRKISRYIFRLYPFEYGRYTLLQKIFFPYLAPKSGDAIQEEIIQTSIGFKLKVSPKEFLHGYFYCFGSYEQSTVLALQSLVKKGDTVVNIGANIGYMTFVLSRAVQTTGKVFAIEPEARNYAWLNENIRINKVQNITAIQKAISNSEGVLSLYISDENSGAHSLFHHHQSNPNNVQQIATTTFDTLAKEYKIQSPTLMLIDVEGFEKEVFEGMQQTISTYRPIFIVELNDTILQQRSSSANALARQICSFDYFQYRVHDSGKLFPASDVVNFENGVFIPSEKRSLYSNLFI